MRRAPFGRESRSRRGSAPSAARVAMRASASKNSCSRSRMLSSAMRLPARCTSASRYGFSMLRQHAVAAPLDAHQHVAGAGAGLDAVVDRVLEQRLQHQRRQQRVGRRAVELPGDAQPLAQAQLLDARVALEQRDLVGEAHELRARPPSACGTGPPGPRARARRAAGRARISESTAFRLLNRKCGRMRACSACSRASASAGECALASRRNRRAARRRAARTSTSVLRQRRASARRAAAATAVRYAGGERHARARPRPRIRPQYGRRAQQRAKATNSTVTISEQQRLDQRRRLHEALAALRRDPARRTARRRAPPRSRAIRTRAMTPRLRKSGSTSG